MNFKDYIIGVVLLGIFIFAMMSGNVLLSKQNNANNTLMENEAVNRTFGNLTTILGNISNESQTAKTKFEQEKSSIATGFFLLGTILSIGKTFITMMVSVYNLTFGLIASVLGVSKMVINVLAGIFIVIMVLSAWALYKTGK